MVNIHHTVFDFPLDRHFLGESIIIGSLLKYSKKNKNYVVSCGENKVSGPPDLPERIAQEGFNSELVRLNYKKDSGSYLTFVKSVLANQSSPITLNYHFPRSELDIAKRVKSEFGDDVKTVMHFHCMPELYQPDAYNKGSDSRRLEEMLDSNSIDNFIAVSNAVKTAFIYSSLVDSAKISCVKNGIDEKLYQIPVGDEREDLREKIGIKGSTIIGYAGRMNVNKGVEAILDLLRFCDRTNQDYGFVFATSNGSERQYFFNQLTQIAPNLIEEDKVKIVLDVSKLRGSSSFNDELVESHFDAQLSSEGIVKSKVFGGVLSKPVTQALDIYLHPAFSEAISLSILEALATGVPVIGSDTGGIPEVVNLSNGELVSLEKPFGHMEVVQVPGLTDNVSSRNAEKLFEGILNLENRIKRREVVSPDEIRRNVLFNGHTLDKMYQKTQNVYNL